MSNKKMMPWLIGLVGVLISLLVVGVGFSLYQLRSGEEPKEKQIFATASEVCEQYDLEDDFSFSSGYDPDNLGKKEDARLFELAFIGFRIGEAKYERFDDRPYSAWSLIALGTAWIGDGGPYEDEDYQKARAGVVGLYNLTYEEASDLEFREFYQIMKCNELVLPERFPDYYEERGGSAEEGLDELIVDSQTADEAKLRQLMEDGSRDNYFSDVQLYDQLPALLDDIDEYFEADSEENYFRKLNQTNYLEAQKLVEGEVERLKLGYDNSSEQMWNLKDSIFLIFGDAYATNDPVEGLPGEGEVNFVVRDMEANEIVWVPEDVYVQSAELVEDKSVIRAKVYRSYEALQARETPRVVRYNALTGEELSSDFLSGEFRLGPLTYGESRNEGKAFLHNSGKYYFTYLRDIQPASGEYTTTIRLIDVIRGEAVVSQEIGSRSEVDFGFSQDDDFFIIRQNDQITVQHQLDTPDQDFSTQKTDQILSTDLLGLDSFDPSSTDRLFDVSSYDNTQYAVSGYITSDQDYLVGYDNDGIVAYVLTDDGYKLQGSVRLPQSLQGPYYGFALDEQEEFAYFATRYGEFHKMDFRSIGK